MTLSPMPVFLLASLLVHSLVLLQSAQMTAPSLSNAGTFTPLRISIVKSSSNPPQPVQATHRTELTVKPATARKTPGTAIVSTRTRKLVTNKPTIITQPENTIHQLQPLAAAHQTSRPSFNTRQVRNKIGNALQQRLNATFKYPWLARKRGWQGRVMLSLRVERNGRLSNIKIRETSGYRLLDNSALDSVTKIKNLPDAVGLLQGNTLTLQIPVQFQLQDS